MGRNKIINTYKPRPFFAHIMLRLNTKRRGK